jgi:transposase
MSADAASEMKLLRELVTALRTELEQARQENTLLRQKIDLLVRRVFGSSSEQIDPAQLELLLQLPSALPVAPEKALAEKDLKICVRSRQPETLRCPADLPVVEEVIDPEPVKAAPQNWRCIGQEVSEQLDYEPARFLRRRLIRRKYVHRLDADRAPLIARLPDRLQERGLASPGLLAHVIVSKYCDHLPLYRQEQIYLRRHGVHLPRQTLARWMELAADWLRPIYQEIRTGVMSGGYIQVDETPIEYLEPGHGQTRQGYLWTCARPGGDVLFQWHTSRAADCLNKLIAVNFTGTLQCDGYNAYDAFARRRGGRIELAGCWAHVRRKFFDALEQSPRTAGWVMRQIQHLYRIEAWLRERRAGPGLRAVVRAHQSRPIVERIYKALERLKLTGRFLPQSLFGEAMDYALGQWPGLTVFLKDGRFEIDNNLVENAIRPTALGKKNWLFIGQAEAGERGAILYTMVESCRRRGLDPYAYLCDVLTRLPHMTNWQIKEVTPEAWAKAKKAILLKAAS